MFIKGLALSQIFQVSSVMRHPVIQCIQCMLCIREAFKLKHVDFLRNFSIDGFTTEKHPHFIKEASPRVRRYNSQ